MEFFQWHWWAGLAILLMIAEIFVPGFFLLCLGIGAAGASVADAVGLGAPGQLIAFSAFSLIAFFTIRPLLMKRMWNTPEVRTNVEALVGQRGKVTQDFDPGLRLGRVAAAGGRPHRGGPRGKQYAHRETGRNGLTTVPSDHR